MTSPATNSRPMDGVRVLDIATFIAAPMAASIMGEFGADVIKIEQPSKDGQAGGDPWRRYGTASKREDSSLAWLTEARNKRSITLNLRAPEGAELFKRLVADADVVTENFRPGTLAKWGLGYDVLAEINPRYGDVERVWLWPNRAVQRPPWVRAHRPCIWRPDTSGRHAGGPPVTPGSTSLGDYMTGMYGAIGVLMALRERDKSGLGQTVDLALYESVYSARWTNWFRPMPQPGLCAAAKASAPPTPAPTAILNVATGAGSLSPAPMTRCLTVCLRPCSSRTLPVPPNMAASPTGWQSAISSMGWFRIGRNPWTATQLSPHALHQKSQSAL